MRFPRHHMYVLIGQTPVPVENSMELAAMFNDESQRRVALTKVGPVTISTVFLGINHQFADGPPILFETMAWIDMEHEAYGKKWDRSWEDYQTRCSTWLEAEEMHRQAIEHFKQYGDDVIDIREDPHGRVAQLAERSADNAEVDGSSPSTPTK